MSNFPSSIPSYAGFTSTDTLAHDNHAAQSNAEQADIAAIATKVGTGASTPVNGTALVGNGPGTSSWRALTGADVGFNQTTVLQAVYPVGCIYTETTGTNPGTTFGFGTWAATGQGRVLVGNGTSDQAFTSGATGGESNHVLSSNEMPSHTHVISDPGHGHNYSWGQASLGSGATTAMIPTGFDHSNATNNNTTFITNNNTGGGTSHNNLQPYLVVFFWQRVS